MFKLNKGISKSITIIVLFLILIGGILIYQCLLKEEQVEPVDLTVEPVDLTGISTEKISLANYYSLASLDISLETSQYNLPLKTSQVSNFKDFSKKIPLSNNAQNLLEKNGFVVIENLFNPKEENITNPYKILKDREIPIFITTDSLLHLYHIQFDETLRQIEEREFYDKIWEISKEFLDDSVEKYNLATGDLKEASKRNVAYFTVGLSLLKPKEGQLYEDLEKYNFEMPDFVKSDVEKEINLIEEHKGFSNSPIFIYKEDYSQYVPRGHYTRSEKLKNYFKAFMWYGRISMLLKKDLIQSDNPEKDARIQTMQACLIASKFALDKDLKEKWDRIYTVTAFYVGLADDLGPYEYIEALNSVFNGKFAPNDLTKENIDKLKIELAKYQPPKIYGGTGNCTVASLEEAEECLEATKGFRLMGQRFIPDSYMFTNLVSPFVGMYVGNREPFTMCVTNLGPARCFPRGLDVMALLGSNRAKELLKELGDTEYEGKDEKGNKISYETQFEKLKEEFDKFNEADWNRNLYWSWLYTLKPLLEEFGQGFPTFMQTKAWQDKELTTALASWAELRHDTILYAKQSYTMELTAMPPMDKPVVGYIEPVPEFYNRLLALTKMTFSGLDEMNVLDEKAKQRLKNLEKILEKLVNLSKKELENKELEKQDYDFIKNFGNELNGVIADVDDKAKKTTIIADVHTDSNTKQVLEQGVGYVKLIAVAYKVPDGRILIGVGPVMSYYEFKHSMADRLTDEKWQDILESGFSENPEWISNFSD